MQLPSKLARAEADAYEARRMARLSPFASDRERFNRIADQAEQRAAQIRACGGRPS